jgi:3'(2'), 5'-bisphosphate nucleotidase
MTADARLAASVAGQAGALLVEMRVTSGLTGKDLGKRGDAHSNAFLLHELARARPGDAVLSEESLDSPERLSANRVWIIDPLDGTREYGMPGRDDWAVHVALWEHGAGITAAAVAQPSRNTVYASDSAPLTSRAGSPLRILVSDSRPPSSYRWVRLARRRWPSCGGTRMPTYTPAVSGNGTRQHPSASPEPRAYMPPA